VDAMKGADLLQQGDQDALVDCQAAHFLRPIPHTLWPLHLLNKHARRIIPIIPNSKEMPTIKNPDAMLSNPVDTGKINQRIPPARQGAQQFGRIN